MYLYFFLYQAFGHFIVIYFISCFYCNFTITLFLVLFIFISSFWSFILARALRARSKPRVLTTTNNDNKDNTTTTTNNNNKILILLLLIIIFMMIMILLIIILMLVILIILLLLIMIIVMIMQHTDDANNVNVNDDEK